MPKFVFLDPLGVNEADRGREFLSTWKKYVHIYNSERLQAMRYADVLPNQYKIRIPTHQIQNDATSCGVWTMVVSIIPQHLVIYLYNIYRDVTFINFAYSLHHAF